MRIALLSDIHANHVALMAVLKDVERFRVDRVACLGDIATLGPNPTAVLQTLRELDCLCIMGNHDEFLLDRDLVHTYTEIPIIVEAVDWCRDRLTQEDLDFLRTFQPSIRIALEPDIELLLFHGSPRSHMENLLSTTPPDELDSMLDGQLAVVMAGGHTHIQMLRQHRGMLIVNPGSVGLPFKEFVAGQKPTVLLHAEYAIVEVHEGAVHIDLRRVPLQRSVLRDVAVDSDSPLAELLLEHYS